MAASKGSDPPSVSANKLQKKTKQKKDIMNEKKPEIIIHEEPVDCSVLQKCCGDKCPFSRAVQPGGLGGSPPEVYIGQAKAGFWLPCHKNYDPTKSPKDQDPTKVGQCAGAAIFRANCGWSDEMPEFIQRLPSDKEAVFADPAEFIAHHYGMSLDFVRKHIDDETVKGMGIWVRNQSGAKLHAVPKKEVK